MRQTNSSFEQGIVFGTDNPLAPKTELPRGLSSVERGMLAEFKRRIMKRFDDEILEIILFGSRARGEGHEESDLDAAVLVKEEYGELRRNIIDIATEIYQESDINISPLVMSKKRFEWLKSIERGIALDIAKDGIRI